MIAIVAIITFKWKPACYRKIIFCMNQGTVSFTSKQGKVWAMRTVEVANELPERISTAEMSTVLSKTRVKKPKKKKQTVSLLTVFVFLPLVVVSKIFKIMPLLFLLD